MQPLQVEQSTGRLFIALDCHHHIQGQCLQQFKARYTLATKSTVAETDNKSATKSTVTDMVDFAAGFGNKSSTTLIRQLVAVDFVAYTVNFVANMVDFVARPKATRSTLSTFFQQSRPCWFNFAASVYRALQSSVINCSDVQMMCSVTWFVRDNWALVLYWPHLLFCDNTWKLLTAPSINAIC